MLQIASASCDCGWTTDVVDIHDAHHVTRIIERLRGHMNIRHGNNTGTGEIIRVSFACI